MCSIKERVMEELENIREEADEIETGAAEVRGRQQDGGRHLLLL